MFAKENAETQKLNAALRETKLARAERKDVVESKKEDRFVSAFHFCLDACAYPFCSETEIEGRTFTWEKVDYTVPVPGGTRRLLHNVYGYVKPGTMTALMGSSGAGKTTCLDVLAQRKNIGVISGNLLVDGRPLDSDFARGTAYGTCSSPRPDS